MKERPILFNGEMVRAILEGRKTQTRRVVKPQPQLMNGKFEFTGNNGKDTWPEPDVWLALTPSGKFGLNDPPYYKCPYGKPRNRLWVRETFGYDNIEYVKTYKDEPWRGRPDAETAQTFYRADEIKNKTDHIFPSGYWKPSIHMPRWASRITLEITDVRVERVQDISEGDALAEGVQHSSVDCLEHFMGFKRGNAIRAFEMGWNSINEKLGFGWNDNPWVWVVEFERIRSEEQ